MVLFGVQIQIFNFHFPICNLSKWLSSRESGFDVVPPFQLIAFVGFPAEKDNAAISHRRKIDEALAVIFQLNSERLELARR